jgi:ubiquinone/menaquinone biosynthesis C-methylase UbiE
MACPVVPRWRGLRHRPSCRVFGHTVIGVDTSPEMLAVARAKIAAADFREGDLHQLPVPDQHVDVVVCALALTHVPVRPS